MENNKVERQEIYLNPFPEWEGKTTHATLKANDNFKYGYDVPIPETEDEAQEYYKSSLAELIELGVKGRTHTVSRLVINNRAEEGKDPEDEDFCAELTSVIPAELLKSVRKAGTKSEATKIGNALMVKYKVSTLAELEAKIKEELDV